MRDDQEEAMKEREELRDQVGQVSYAYNPSHYQKLISPTLLQRFRTMSMVCMFLKLLVLRINLTDQILLKKL